APRRRRRARVRSLRGRGRLVREPHRPTPVAARDLARRDADSRRLPSSRGPRRAARPGERARDTPETARGSGSCRPAVDRGRARVGPASARGSDRLGRVRALASWRVDDSRYLFGGDAVATVLIVEDDDAIRGLLAKMFSARGFETILAHNGADAV